MSEQELFMQQRIAVGKVKYRRPGRPMKPGKYVYDPTTHRFGFFLGLCNHCHAKFIQPKEDLPPLLLTIHKQKKSWKVRLLKWLEKKLAT
jgi:hypothetical protein